MTIRDLTYRLYFVSRWRKFDCYTAQILLWRWKEDLRTSKKTDNLAKVCISLCLSDHLPVFAYFSGKTLTRDGENKVFISKIADENLRKFNENVSNTNWASFLDEDPNMAYNNFIDEYSRVYNACFPLKVIKGKLLNNCSSPWIIPGLLKSINKKI